MLLMFVPAQRLVEMSRDSREPVRHWKSYGSTAAQHCSSVSASRRAPASDHHRERTGSGANRARLRERHRPLARLAHRLNGNPPRYHARAGEDCVQSTPDAFRLPSGPNRRSRTPPAGLSPPVPRLHSRWYRSAPAKRRPPDHRPPHRRPGTNDSRSRTRLQVQATRGAAKGSARLATRSPSTSG